MSRSLVLTLVGGLMIAVAAFAQQPFVGKWEVTVEVPGGVKAEPIVWTVTGHDGEYAVATEGGNGAMNSWLGTPTSVQVAVDGTKFTMTSTFRPGGADAFVIVNSGVIDGDTLAGTSKWGKLGEYRLTGKRL